MTCKPSSKLSLFKAATKPFCANYHVLSTSIVYTISTALRLLDIDFYWKKENYNYIKTKHFCNGGKTDTCLFFIIIRMVFSISAKYVAIKQSYIN